MTDDPERQTLADEYGVETVYTGSSFATHIHLDDDCRQLKAGTDVRDRPADAFPVDHRPVCPLCERTHAEDDERGVATDGGHLSAFPAVDEHGSVSVVRWR